MTTEIATNEISNYLSILKSMLKDDDIKLIIKEDLVKNYTFKYLYNVNKHKIIGILLSLREDEFYKKVVSNNSMHEGDILYIWNPIRLFTNARGELCELRLYIKTYVNINNRMIVIISFHEFNDFS